MKVRLTASRAEAAGVQTKGDVIFVDDAEGRALIESGAAEPVAEKQSDRAERRPAAVRAETR